MRMTFQKALDALCEKYGKYGYEREFLADLLNSGYSSASPKKHDEILKDKFQVRCG